MKRYLVTTVYSTTFEVIANDYRDARRVALLWIWKHLDYNDWPARISEVKPH
jgi:hypothetical protein